MAGGQQIDVQQGSLGIAENDEQDELVGSEASAEQGAFGKALFQPLRSRKVVSGSATAALIGRSASFLQGAFGKLRTRVLSGINMQSFRGTVVASGSEEVPESDVIPQQIIPPDLFAPHEGEGATGGGVTGTDVHRRWIPWINTGGDWADANGTPQGNVAYASAAVSGGAGQVRDFNVTTLVQQWFDGIYDNHGMFIRRTNDIGVANFHSKESSAEASRPKLTVVAANGTFELLPDSDSRCIVGGLNALGTEEILGITATGFSVIRFKFDGIEAPITSAVLRLVTTSTNNTPIVGVFRVNLDEHQAPIPFETGIASEFVMDEGIANHPDVIFADNYSDYPVVGPMSALNDEHSRTKGWFHNAHFTPPEQRGAGTFREGTEENARIIGDTDGGYAPWFAADPNFEPIAPGRKCVRSSIGHIGSDGISLNNGTDIRWYNYGNLGPIWETANAAGGNPGHPEEPDELYARCYIRLGTQWEPRPEGGKFPSGFLSNYDGTLTGTQTNIVPTPPGGPYTYLKPNKPPRGGNGGQRSYTCAGWSQRSHFGALNPLELDTPLSQAGYRRLEIGPEDWWSVENGALDSAPILFGTLGLVPKNKWTCFELRIKLNTIDTSGATKAYVGYPWGGLFSETGKGPAGIVDIGVPNNQNDKGDVISGGANSLVVNWPATTGANVVRTDARNARGTLNFYRNHAIRISSRPNEWRRITDYVPGTIDGVTGEGTGTITVDSFDGSPNNWGTVPSAGELFEIIPNPILKERTTLWYGNRRGHIYADENALLWGTTTGIPAGLQDDFKSESPGIGRRDGIRQVWIDGRKTLDIQDVWWRSIPNVQIQGIWYTFFMGGSSPRPTYPCDLYWGEVVFAKRYIGPMRKSAVNPPPPPPPPPPNLPTWAQNLSLYEVYQIPGTHLTGPNPTYENYSPTTRFHQVNRENMIIDAENGLCVREADSSVIFACGGGHADFSGNQIVYINLEQESPGPWVEAHPGSNICDVWYTNPCVGGYTPYGGPFNADGLPSSCHNYDRLHFVNSLDKIVRVQAPATAAQGSPTYQDCFSFDWATKQFSAPGSVPPVPWGSTTWIDPYTQPLQEGVQLVGGGACKDPITEEIYSWSVGRAIWKLNPQSNTWTSFMQAADGAPIRAHATPFASDGTRLVHIQGGATGEIRVIDQATKAVTVANVVGPAADAFKNIGTRAVLTWIPPLNAFFFIPGRQSTMGYHDRIFKLYQDGSGWVGEELSLSGFPLPSTPTNFLGPCNRLAWVPRMGGVVFVPRSTVGALFFRVI